MDINLIIQHFGPYVALLYIVIREVWPWFRDKIWPEHVQRQKDEAKDLQERLERNRTTAQQREDRLFTLIEYTTKTLADISATLHTIQQSMTALQTEMQHHTDVLYKELERHANVLHSVNLDVAGLYGHLQTPRPSRLHLREETDE